MTREERIGYLRAHLDTFRFEHSLAVETAATELALRFGADPEQAALAGLVHDCAKQLPPARMFALARQHRIHIDEVQRRAPGLLHGYVGAAIAKELLDVTDPMILHAIQVHVTGSMEMNLLDKILYVADYVEPSRTFEGMDNLRQVLYTKGLDAAMCTGLKMTMQDVLKRGYPLHLTSVKAYNKFINEKEDPHVRNT